MMNVLSLIVKAGPYLVTNAEYKAMWGKIFAIPLGFFAFILVFSLIVEFSSFGCSSGASYENRIKALEEYQRDYLNNKNFTYEGYVNGSCKLYIKEKDGTITKV